MEFSFQQAAKETLEILAKQRRHSILISGITGCGKSYLANYFRQCLGIEDIVYINPVVTDIRNISTFSYSSISGLVVCIEDLDTGVAGASYAMLKFLEEPQENIYIVVTCTSASQLPDTILSRSIRISLPSPTDRDIRLYAESQNESKFQDLCVRPIWIAVSSFSDVDTLFNLPPKLLEHFYTPETFLSDVKHRPVSNLIWDFQHYADGTEIPCELLKLKIRYILKTCKSKHLVEHSIRALGALDVRRISTHAILGYYLLQCKYGG